jgi:hypothetical protein
MDSDEESEEDEEDEKDDVNVEERKDESEFSESEDDDGLFVTSPSSGSQKEPTSYVEDRTLSRYWFYIYLLYIEKGSVIVKYIHKTKTRKKYLTSHIRHSDMFYK